MMWCEDESITKCSAKVQVTFKTKIKTRKSFRIKLESGHVREDGGMHEDELETLGGIRGNCLHEGTDGLIHVGV